MAKMDSYCNRGGPFGATVLHVDFVVPLSEFVCYYCGTPGRWQVTNNPCCKEFSQTPLWYGEGPFAFSPRLHDRSKPDGRPDGSPKGPGQLQWGRPYLQLNALDAGRAFRLHEGLHLCPDPTDTHILLNLTIPH